MAKQAAKTPDVDGLVRLTLLSVANAQTEPKLSGKGALFATKTGANKDAIDRCLNPERPLLRVVRTEKTNEFVGLAPAGFELIAKELPEEKVGPMAKTVALGLTPTPRIQFLHAIIGRTPDTAAELTPVLEAATLEEAKETEARVAAAAARREKDEANKKALELALKVFEERKTARIKSLKRELEAEGYDFNENEAKGEKPTPAGESGGTRDEVRFDKVPPQERFRQYARRYVSAWLEAINLGKVEARQFMEVAMGNMDGFEQIGEEGERVAFNGKHHRAKTGVSTGAQVTVVHPGWKLVEDDGEYIIEPALVAP